MGRWILVILAIIGFGVVAYLAYQYFFAKDEPAPVIELGSIVTLACTPECASYGQCGINLDTDLPVILAGKDNIMVEQQNFMLSIAVDMKITAKNTAKVKVSALDPDQGANNDGEEMDVQFWKLGPSGTPPEDVQEGWVAEWCVIAKTTDE